jgi:S1-C subfamily serine protease
LGKGQKAVSTAADLIESRRNSVCQLKVDGNGRSITGTGFIIKPEGHLVTCHHVSKPGFPIRRITAQFIDGTELGVRQVLWEDEATDLAVLELDHAPPEQLQLGASADLRPGDEIMFLGYPLGTRTLSATRGFVSAKGTNLAARRPTELIQVDATVQRGNSGGPVFSVETGLVIGVISLKYVPLFQQVQRVQEIVGKWPYRGQGGGSVNIMGVDFGQLFNFLGSSLDAITGTLVNISVGIGWAVPVEQIQRT